MKTVRKKTSTSPTKRSLAMLRKLGYRAAVVEKWNKFAGVRQDLFGFADILAIRPPYRSPKGSAWDQEGENVLVQTTTRQHMKERQIKINQSSNAWVWLQIPGNKIVVHGWEKSRGSDKVKWSCLVEEIINVTLHDGSVRTNV